MQCLQVCTTSMQPSWAGTDFYQVILKRFIWGTEPLQGKGGFLKMIPKRLGAVEAKHFRGILLLPTLAKRVHAMARARLMTQASRQRDPAQVGGYAGQQVAFGAQTLRALTNIFSAWGMSSAVLYVDLATAFHHPVRQLVTGIAAKDDWQYVCLTPCTRLARHLRQAKQAPIYGQAQH